MAKRKVSVKHDTDRRSGKVSKKRQSQIDASVKKMPKKVKKKTRDALTAAKAKASSSKEYRDEIRRIIRSQ